MKVLGLTGPTGSGKGVFCKVLSQFENIAFLDTDKTAREVCKKGSLCLAELSEYFGAEILLDDGTLNRKALSALAFCDSIKHNALNKITHKYILEDIQNFINKKSKDGYDLCVIDAPLLFESGCDKMCDKTLCVISDKNIRLSRIIERDNISQDEALMRMNAQKSDEYYKEKCDYVLENNKSIPEFEQESKTFIEKILKEIC